MYKVTSRILQQCYNHVPNYVKSYSCMCYSFIWYTCTYFSIHEPQQKFTYLGNYFNSQTIWKFSSLWDGGLRKYYELRLNFKTI